MVKTTGIEELVRSRLRSLRTTRGLSLDDVAARSRLSASTISRIETGKRTIGLDVLVPLAHALEVDLDTLLAQPGDDDVVIRPTRTKVGGMAAWTLSKATGQRVALRLRLTPTRTRVEQRVHPGHDWFHVIEGTVTLHLGDRDIIVRSGEAAEFDTMTPHALSAHGGPAEVVMVFDHDARRAHLDT